MEKTDQFRKGILLLVILSFKPLPCHADLSMVQEIESFDDGKVVKKEQISTQISARRLRVDIGQAMSSIVLPDRKVTYSILHSARQYVVLKHDPLNPAMGSHPSKAAPVFKATGKTERISGFFCRQFLSAVPQQEAWLAEGGMSFQEFQKEILPWGPIINFYYLILELEKDPRLHAIPIRMIDFDGNQIMSRSTLEKLDSSKIPDSVFEVPAGYEEIKPQ